METVKRSAVARGWREGGREEGTGRAQRIFGADEEMYRKSLYFLLNFHCEPKTAVKNKVY